MTRRERLERKVEKRQEWAEKARNRSEAAYEASHAAVENIPFGQPILVGHHSERGHRAALNRADNAMHRCVDESKKAKHHDSKAKGLELQLKSTIFSDDENAVEALGAKIANLEANREAMKKANAAWRKAGKIRPEGTNYGDGRPYAAWELSNLSATIRTAKKRIASIEAEKAQKAKTEGLKDGEFLLEQDRRSPNYSSLTFPAYPGRETIAELKAAGWWWSRPSWCGQTAKLPERYKTEE